MYPQFRAKILEQTINFSGKVAYLDIRKGLYLGLKAEKQLQNENHTEDWALDSILVIMAT